MNSTAQQSQSFEQHHRRMRRLEITGSERRPEPLPSDGALSDLLGSTATSASFTTEYWCRRPLFIKGYPEKLQELFPGGFGRRDFDQAVRKAAASKVKGFQLLARRHRSLGAPGRPPVLAIEPDQIEWLLQSGANIRADAISDRRVASFAAELKAQLNHLGAIYLVATLSPRGNGWPPHIDRSSVVFIQCEGRKRFLISPEPVASWPQRSLSFSSGGTVEDYPPEAEAWEEVERVDMDRLVEFVLEPGDALFLPPGTIHATESVSESSLTLDLVFDHANFLDLINRLLERTLKSNPAWRHFAPVSSAAVKPGELPADAAVFFAERLAELRAVIDALTPETLELNRQWQKMIADPGESTLAGISLGATERMNRPVERQDLLRVSRRAPITYALGAAADGEASLDLYFADKEVSVAGEWVPFLQTMVAKGRFTAASATTWAGKGEYPWETVREYLETLLDQGILERDI